jgi:putative addiction module component (TIGR02574 family)
MLEKILSFEYKRTDFEFSLIGADEVVKSFNNLMQYAYSFDPSSLPLTDGQREELARRMKEHRSDPKAAKPLTSVLERIRNRN